MRSSHARTAFPAEADEERKTEKQKRPKQGLLDHSSTTFLLPAYHRAVRAALGRIAEQLGPKSDSDVWRRAHPRTAAKP